MIFTGGMSLSGGMLASISSGAASWATISQSSPLITVVDNTATTNSTVPGGTGAGLITNGIKNVTSTMQNLSYEVLINEVGSVAAGGPRFFTGVVNPNTINITNLGNTNNRGKGFGYYPQGLLGQELASLANFEMFGGLTLGAITTDPGNNRIPINNGDVMGIVVNFINNSTGSLLIYLNGVLRSTDVLNLTGQNQITLFTGWQTTGSGLSVTMRTNPSTFSYGANYTNQNGWPA